MIGRTHSVEAEQAVLGGLMLDNSAWDAVADRITSEDFFRNDHKVIFRAIAELAARGEPFDAVTLAEQLDRNDQLEHTGGLDYIARLPRETPTAVNICSHADIVREHSRVRQIQKAALQLSTEQDAAEIELQSAAIAVLASGSNRDNVQRSITARHVSALLSTPSQVRWLPGLHKKLERGVIAIMAGKRGSYKSSVALHWSMDTARQGEHVLIVSAEGSGSDRRIRANIQKYGGDETALCLYFIERRVDFNSRGGIDSIMAEIQRLKIKPALVVIDTLSKNSGALEENDNTEMKQFIGGLDMWLRTPLDCTVLIVAHTGHGEQNRPRGASALEADTDAAYIVTKLSDKAISVSRERFKDAPDMEPLGYAVEVVSLGYEDDCGDPVTSCVLVSSDFVPTKAQPTGKCQRQLLSELERRSAAGDVGIWTEGELREIARNLGMHKSSARDSVHGLRQLGYFVPTIGGSRLTFVPTQRTKERNWDESSVSTRSVRDEKDEGSIEPVLSSRTSSLGATK